MKYIELEQEYYFFGNKTPGLIEGSKGNPVLVNTITTRGQRRQQAREMPVVQVVSEFSAEDGEQGEWSLVKMRRKKESSYRKGWGRYPRRILRKSR